VDRGDEPDDRAVPQSGCGLQATFLPPDAGRHRTAWTQPVDDTLTVADATAVAADYRAAADTVTPTDATASIRAHFLETIC
jgi:hypothetical protein